MNTRKTRQIFTWLAAIAMAVATFVGAATAQTVTYIHTDALGSPVAETDASGNVINRFSYEPYGAVIGQPVMDGPGYTGHVSDASTGLSYMQQRYMDPQLGAFLSVDPVTAYRSGDMRHFNAYAYAYNNPYTFNDPDGRCGACDRQSDQFAKDAAAGNTEVYSPFVKPASIIASAALPVGPAVRGLLGVIRAMASPSKGQDSAGSSSAPRGDPHAPGDVPNAGVIVRGGAGEMPAPGSVFSGSQGRSIEEAAAGVPHGTIRSTTAGEIRAGGGKVDVAPEPTKSGQINYQHVNVREGAGGSFGSPQSNPVPKLERVK